MLERILGMVLGKAGKGAQGNLLSALLPMLIRGGGAGGLDLGSILGNLQGGGMGSKVDSWTGSGANERLSARDVRRAIDPIWMRSLARPEFPGDKPPTAWGSCCPMWSTNSARTARCSMAST